MARFVEMSRRPASTLLVGDDAIAQLLPKIRKLAEAGEAASRVAIRDALGFADVRGDLVRQGDAAQEVLDAIHERLLVGARETVERRSAAEWLFYLRRFTKMFAFNRRRTTEPYSRSLAEVLSQTSSRPAPDETWAFDRDEAAAKDITAVVAAVRPIYRIHSLLRWAGKGADIRFTPWDYPEEQPSADTAAAVELYDSRNAAGGGGLLSRAGLHAPYLRDGLLSDDAIRTSIMIGVQDAASGHYFPSVFDVRSARVLADWSIPAELRWPEALVDITVLLYGMLRDRRYLDVLADPSVSTFPFSGYLLDHRWRVLQTLGSAIGEIRRSELGGLLPTSLVMASPAEVYDRLLRIVGSPWPLERGSPLRRLDGDQSVFVDLVGATQHWAELLQRPPVTGAEVNIWAAHYEDDLQAVIDRTSWRPTADTVRLRRRTLRGPDGRAITDVDALGERGDDLLLVSGKSIPYTASYDRGDHREVRNRATDLSAHVDAWAGKMQVLRDSPVGRNYDISRFRRIAGVVVTPFPVYVPVGSATLDVLDGLGAAVSASEFEAWLRRETGLAKRPR